MTEKTTTAAVASQQKSQTVPDRTTLIAFVGFVVLSGGAAIAIRSTYGELAPYWSGALRFTLVALTFWLLLLARRVPVPRGRALAGAALFGFLSVGAAFLFIYYGLTRTPASLYQTTAAIVPLLTVFFAAAHKLEPLRKRGIAGGLLAVAGIATAVSGSLFSGVEVSLPHILAIVAGAACFAEAGIVAKLFPRSHPLAMNSVAMTVGAAMLALASLIKGEPWVLPAGSSVWLAILYLVVASIGAFLLYLFVLSRWTASGASYGFVLVPIVTVVLASVLTDEIISLVFLAGAAVVLLGVYIGALMPSRKPAVPGEEVVPVPAAAAADALAEDIQVRPGLPNCV